MCLYVPGFQRQVIKHVKILSERSKESKEQKKKKGSVLVVESAYKAQNAQLGLSGQLRTLQLFVFLTKKVLLHLPEGLFFLSSALPIVTISHSAIVTFEKDSFL